MSNVYPIGARVAGEVRRLDEQLAPAAAESLTPTLDERAAFIASIRPGSRVVVRHGRRELIGQVTSTVTQGTALLSIGFYAPDLGPNRIDDAICVKPVDILRPAAPA